jgi:hypothetical protein
LLLRGEKVSRALIALADELAVGIDVAARPLHREISGLPRGVRGTIIFAAQQRRYCKEMAAQARNLAESWRQIVAGLPALQETMP